MSLATRNAAANRGRRSLARVGALAGALLLLVLHFASFEVFERPMVTDIRYYLYFAWQTAEGAVPHLDFFDNKTQLATFTGALFHKLGSLVGAEPLHVVRFGYLTLAAAGGLLVFFIMRQLGGGSGAAGLLGAAAYCSFGFMGVMPSIGPMPKLLMAVMASAMALLVYRRRWFLAGVAGALAFMDWQIGFLVWAAALVSALLYGEPRIAAGLRVVGGGLAGVGPFALYYLATGALGSTLYQTIVVSFFRGASAVGWKGLHWPARRIWDLLFELCPQHEWLFAVGFAGLVVTLIWLVTWRHTSEWRLLFPASVYHFGVVAYSLIDFQKFGDFFLLLHSAAFFVGISWIALWLLLRNRLAVISRPSDGWKIVPEAVLVALILLVSRPGFLRPRVDVESRAVAADVTLSDQREVAASVAEQIEGRRFLFLSSSELLYLMERRNGMPIIYWNRATMTQYSRSETETRDESAARVVREFDPEVLIFPPRLTPSAAIGNQYDAREIESRSGTYSVVLRSRRVPSDANPGTPRDAETE